MQDEQRKQIIEIWKVIVEVQRHFNDISMRIRSTFVAILLALFASIGFLLDKKLSLEIWIFKIQFATFVPLFGILGTYLFYFIDRHWYHRLLLGSVKHAIIIENKYKNEMPELSLSEAIGAESPYKPRGAVRWLANLLVSHDKYRETGQLHSEGKIEFFYRFVALLLMLATIVLAWVGGITIDKKTPPTLDTPVPTSASAPPPPAPAPLPVTAPTSPSPAPADPAAPAPPPAPPASPARKTE